MKEQLDEAKDLLMEFFVGPDDDIEWTWRNAEEALELVAEALWKRDRKIKILKEALKKRIMAKISKRKR